MKNINQIFDNIVTILDLENNSPSLISAKNSDGLWEVSIRTISLIYDLYYEEKSNELLGIDFEPIVEEYVFPNTLMIA